MQTKILQKKGYMLTVTSWEGDSDSYQEKNIYGSLEEIKAYIELCKLLECSSVNDLGIGNAQINKIHYPKILKLFEKNNTLFKGYQCNINITHEEVINIFGNIAMDLIGFNYETEMFRAYDRHVVTYLEEDAIVEIIDL